MFKATESNASNILMFHLHYHRFMSFLPRSKNGHTLVYKIALQPIYVSNYVCLVIRE